MSESKPCKGCGMEMRPADFSAPCMFRRSKFCGMDCWLRWLRRRSSVGPDFILLPNGQRALISPEDAALCAGRAWAIDSQGYVTGGRERLHRLIARPGPGQCVDHINRDKLDNRRENLRVTTNMVNCRNAGLRAKNKSGVAGVSWDRARGKWSVEIKAFYRKHFIGRFDSIDEARAARERAEREIWGDAR